jgi:ankyrin repeat protein
VQPEKELVMPRPSLPTRTLRDRPDLDQLKRQAKELLEAFRAGDAAASKEVHTHFQRADPSTFALHDAQLVLARAHGFDSWPKLKAFVDGVTVRRLIDAVGRGDLDTVRSMVAARPELVRCDLAENDEHQALHHAVLHRQSAIVRFLMEHGADARKGIWPHRAATSAFTLAAERGYGDLVTIIEEEERRRSGRPRLEPPPPATMPSIDRPLPERRLESAARAAIAAGDTAWLQARHAEGALGNGYGLVSHAVAVDRPDMLALLLDFGLDPDEAGRVEGLEDVVPTWGEPLRACALSGKLAMAQILLTRGANANTNVYASSWALYEAHKRRDEPMIELLEKHGGRLTAVAVAELGLEAHAARLLADDAEGRTADGITGSGSSVVQDLLWGAIESPSPEIVGITLRVTDWSSEDPRWHGILENGLYLRPESDRPRHLEAFRLVLDRCDPNVRSRRGTTLLHEVAASRGGLTASDRIAYTTLLLDRGARHDVRDHLLRSTPLGWACRWGRIEMVELLLERGADPVEADAEPWATPAEWARKTGHAKIERLVRAAGAR